MAAGATISGFLYSVRASGYPDVYYFANGATRQDGLGVDVPADERSYADGHALSRFITSSLDRADHQPHDHAMLVLWGHAYDFAFGRSLAPRGSVDALDFAVISGVFERLQREAQAQLERQNPGAYSGRKPPTLDVLAFDACDIATVELACQLQKYVKFLVASQVGVPIPGWPYDLILERLKDPKGRLMSPPELGAYAVRRFCAAYDALSPVTMTLLNLAHVPTLQATVRDFAVELDIAIEQPEVRQRVLECFVQSQTETGKPFVDVADLCLTLMGEDDYPRLASCAKAVGNLLVSSPEDAVGNSAVAEGWPLVAEHGRNSVEMVRLNGLSLYAPLLAAVREPDEVKRRYLDLEFARDTQWGNAVRKLGSLL